MTIQVRSLARGDLEALASGLPTWSSLEYPRRLRAQEAGELVQAVAWSGHEPVGRGMVLFVEHEEYSVSAARERCAEVRDVWVEPTRRRTGVARAIMMALEDAALEHGSMRIGLSVSLDDEAAPARALYDALGYRHAHGPFLTSTVLRTDDEPMPVAAVLTFLVKDL